MYSTPHQRRCCIKNYRRRRRDNQERRNWFICCWCRTTCVSIRVKRGAASDPGCLGLHFYQTFYRVLPHLAARHFMSGCHFISRAAYRPTCVCFSCIFFTQYTLLSVFSPFEADRDSFSVQTQCSLTRLQYHKRNGLSEQTAQELETKRLVWKCL